MGRLAAVEGGSCTVTVTLSVQGPRLARVVGDLEDRDERRFVFVLRGRSGAHRYALIRTGENDDDWLLHLSVDQP